MQCNPSTGSSITSAIGRGVNTASPGKSPQEANDIFVEFHASAIGAHCGVDKTMHAILQRHYWPGMKADITKWVSALLLINKIFL